MVLEGAGNQVFVYEPNEESGMGKAQRKTVEIGFTDSDNLEVLSGLSDGDLVITVGQEGLRPGANVRLVGQTAPVARQGDGQQPQGRTGKSGERPSRSGAGQQGGVAASGSGSGDGGDRTQRILAMIERTPEAKKEYDIRLKKDPDLAKNPEKLRAFVGEMREKGIIQMRGRQGN